MRRFNTGFCLVILLLAISGCATLDGKLENRLSISIAGDKLFINSMYGDRIGVTSVVSDKDRAALLESVSK